jgi:hypothetical protein
MRKVFLFLAVLAAWITSSAQSDRRPEILVLGTYHMANPGADVYNIQADDVLSPKRQQEIEQLIEVLKRFHPTKIAIEADMKDNPDYPDYLTGKYTLSRSETNQIGYRLAKELRHPAVYPVDQDGDFPLERLQSWAKANGRGEELDAMMSRVGAEVKEEDAFLHSHTVLETFERMNSDSAAAKGIAFYYSFVPFGKSGDYPGSDLLAAWYQRNIRIYHNIVKLIESPNDRILVIFGSGHLGWLQQDVANDESVKLRKLADFTGQK